MTFFCFLPLRGDSDLGPAAHEMDGWPPQRVGQGLGHPQKQQLAKFPLQKINLKLAEVMAAQAECGNGCAGDTEVLYEVLAVFLT